MILLLDMLNDIIHLSEHTAKKIQVSLEPAAVTQWSYLLLDKCVISKQGTWTVNTIR